MDSFRKKLENFTYTFEEIKDKDNGFKFTNSDSFILEEEVKNIIDSLEDDLRQIKKELESIIGLTEIDDIKFMVKQLCVKLY